MKIRQIIALLVLVCILVGCGGVAADTEMSMSSNGKYDGIYEELDPAEVEGGAELTDQKLITTVEVNAETEDLDALMAQLPGQIAALGGYIEYQDTYYGSSYAGVRHRSANLTVRIPAQKLGEFLLHVEGVSNVVSKQQSQENVTLQYVDTESRVAALTAERDRLLELMEQAGDLSDLLKIEERLTEVLYELESTTAQLRKLDNQVSYATVVLYVDEVRSFTETQAQTVWQRIGSGFPENLRSIGDGLADFFVWLVTYSPQLIAIAVGAFLIVRTGRRAVKRRKAKKMEE